MGQQMICKITEPEFKEYQKSCGCTTCDCDAFSQTTYHEGCHTYGLFDQVDDPTNKTESGSYDEKYGPSIVGSFRKNIFLPQEEDLVGIEIIEI